MSTETSLILGYAQIVVPLSFAFPVFLPFFPKAPATGTILSLVYVAVTELWVSVIAGLWTSGVTTTTTENARVAFLVVLFLAFSFSLVYVRLAYFLMLWDRLKGVET